MNTKNIIAAVLAALSVATVCLAHNGEPHTGHPLEGTVATLSDESMQVSTDMGSVTVTFEPGTKFELGMDGKKGNLSDLKKGDFVMVEGTKISTKEIVATQVMIHSQESAEPGHSEK